MNPEYEKHGKVHIDHLRDVEESVMNGLFPYVRLCDIDGNHIVSAKRIKQLTIRRTHWNFIKQKLEHELPPGQYVIECCYDSSRKNLHLYIFTKTESYVPDKKDNQPVAPNPSLIPPTKENPFKMTEKEIYALVKENADLSAKNDFLMQQNGLLSTRISELEASLEEAELSEQPPTPDSLDRLALVFEKIAPKAMPMLDRWFDLQEKRIELEYGKTKQPQQQPAPRIPKTVPATQPENNQEALEKYQQQLIALDNLFNTGKEEEANQVLVEIYQTDPDLYNRICRDLQLNDAEG